VVYTGQGEDPQMTATQRQIDYAISLRDELIAWDVRLGGVGGHPDDEYWNERKQNEMAVALSAWARSPESHRARQERDGRAPALRRFLAPRSTDESLTLSDAVDRQYAETIANIAARRAEIVTMTDEQIAALDRASISTLIDDAKALQ
jgi:hypothetical protein